MDLPKHLNIVALETFYTPVPPLTVPSPHTFTLTEYDRTTLAELPKRIKDAHVLITTVITLRAELLSVEATPNLRLVAMVASGVDSIDLDACRARGIKVVNSPGCNVDAVAEHATALYFTLRRAVMPSMAALRAGEWPQKRTLMMTAYINGASPRSCARETAVIIGYGGVGKTLESILSALGMKVLVAARKGSDSVPPGRVSFDEALKIATVVILCCPRTPETLNLLSSADFASMRPDALLINVARGGVVAEDALLEALEGGSIAGAGVDVFDTEPASAETSVLLRPETQRLNLVVTPHTAWVGMETTAHYQKVLQENIEGFLKGELVPERVKA
ncbi:hypothetical protein S40288_09053 [Stachybotrys chartarum IBT 40288]|nr:hypothetical protein S40288_09053 [Stachybotrys chartarum IBT 40288]